MKKMLLAALCGICLNGAFAQEINCKIENFDITSQEANRSTVISVDDDGAGGSIITRTLSTSGSDPYKDVIGYVFEHYDESMKLIKSYTQDIAESDGGIMGVIVRDSKIVYIDFRFNKSRKSFICTAYTANISDLKFNKKELFVLKKGTVVKKEYGDINYHDRYGKMLLSADKSTFGISIKGYDIKGDEVSKIYVYDTSSLANSITKEFNPNIENREFSAEDFNISADGKAVYILTRGEVDKKVRKQTGLRYQYQLTRITANQVTSHLFEPAEDYPRTLKIVMKQGKLACVGLYSDGEDKYYIATKGVRYYEIDAESLQIIKSKSTPFSAQLLKEKFGDEEQKHVVLRYDFRSVFVTSTNEIIYNAEEYIDKSVVGFNGSPSVHLFAYDDILSIKINDSGEVLWSRNINKEETTGYPLSGVSYTSFIKGEDVYFFFNASSEPEKLDDTRVLFNRDKKHKSSFYVLRVNKNGNFNYKPLVNYEDADQIYYSAAFGFPAKDGKSIFFTGGRQEQRKMIKISLE